MKSAKIEITVTETDSGEIKIQFEDGSIVAIPKLIGNFVLKTSFEVELDYAILKQNKSFRSKHK